jgi:hypothetical protein
VACSGTMTETGLPAYGVRDLKQKIARHLEELARESLDNENVDLGMAARIADALWSLIDAAADRPISAHNSIRGAIDYFVLNRDEVSDLDSRHGFVDDAQVVNEVCAELGLPELRVRI